MLAFARDKVSEGRNNSHICNILLVIVPGMQEKLNKQRMKGSRKTDQDGWIDGIVYYPHKVKSLNV